MSSPLILDCECYESALKSISDAHGLGTSEVTRFLLGVDLDKAGRMDESYDKYLERLFRERFGPPIRPWDAVCWFHLTRVPPITDFAEGILPLNLALNRIWDTVIGIPKETQTRTNLKRLRAMGVPDYLYQMKACAKIHWGPYAMLVREVAFHARSIANHEYLEFPEIIEDICNGYQKQFSERIHEEISAGLQGCIVKFVGDGRGGSRAMTPALFYCWCKAHDQGLSHYSNTCYDGEGRVISRSLILKIEFI